jgi:hypothetical protein
MLCRAPVEHRGLKRKRIVRRHAGAFQGMPSGLAVVPNATAARFGLVLLARSAGKWWTALHDETPEVQNVFRREPLRADVVALSPLVAAASGVTRFSTARKRRHSPQRYAILRT